MKKIFLTALLCLLTLAGCSKEEKYTNYITAKFTGSNSIGVAEVTIDKERLAKELYNYNIEFGSSDGLLNFYSPQKNKYMTELLNSLEIAVDQKSELTNDDEITATLKLKDGKTFNKKFTVKGLTIGEILTEEDISKNMDVKISGYDGRGKIDITWNGTGFVKFDVKNNGQLSNNDTAEIYISKESIQALAWKGFEPENKGPYLITVQGLSTVHKEITDPNVIEEIKEKINHLIPKTNGSLKFEVESVGTFYRQFNNSSLNDIFSDSRKPGQVVEALKIRSLYISTNDLSREYILVIGYEGIFDNDGNLNVENATKIEQDFKYNTDILSKLSESGFNKIGD